MCGMADAYAPSEIGGDHFRTSAVFPDPVRASQQTEGSRKCRGRVRPSSTSSTSSALSVSNTPIPSRSSPSENVDQAVGWRLRLACVYTDTISWAHSDPAACR